MPPAKSKKVHKLVENSLSINNPALFNSLGPPLRSTTCHRCGLFGKHCSQMPVELGFPDSSVGKESTCNAGVPGLILWVRKIPWRKRWKEIPTPIFLGFPCNSAGKESACNVGDLGLIPRLGRSLWEGKGYPLQYCLLNYSFSHLKNIFM